MTRAVLWLVLAASLCRPQQQQQQPPAEPPEEDVSLREKEYSFNPLQAEKEYKVGLFYAKKGSWRAAAGRFQEATRWNPGYADAYWKLGEVLEKSGDKENARQAYAKFLEAAPDDKRASEAKKKLAAPVPHRKN